MLKRVCEFGNDGSERHCPHPVLLQVKSTEDIPKDVCRHHIGEAVMDAWCTISGGPNPVPVFTIPFGYIGELP